MKTSEISKGISSQVFEVRRKIGAKLLQFRLEQGLTQSEAANLCGISTHRIQQIEKGYSLSYRHLALLARLYGFRYEITLRR